MLTLELNEHPSELTPSQTVTGRVGWQLRKEPKKAALRLFWYTEGRGTQDVEIVEELELSPAEMSHEENFSFTLPPQPYSFQGKLITLKWALELVIDKGKDVKRVDLIVSPWVEQVVLSAVEED